MVPAKKKKPDLAVVIGVGKKPPMDEKEPEDEAEDDGDDEAMEHKAMMTLGDAIAAKDWPRAREAFKVMHDLCASAGDETEAEGEE